MAKIHHGVKTSRKKGSDNGHNSIWGKKTDTFKYAAKAEFSPNPAVGTDNEQLNTTPFPRTYQKVISGEGGWEKRKTVHIECALLCKGTQHNKCTSCITCVPSLLI